MLVVQFSDSLACSKRSDSGERCEEKKAMESRGGLGAFLFTSHRSPLSERLEQASDSLALQTESRLKDRFKVYGRSVHVHKTNR